MSQNREHIRSIVTNLLQLAVIAEGFLGILSTDDSREGTSLGDPSRHLDEVRDTAAAIGIGAERSVPLSSLNLIKDILGSRGV